MGRKRITDDEIEINRYIGNKIKKWRKYNKLSQEKFAEKLSISRNQLTLYERGKGDIKASMINNICNILHIPASELFPDIEYTSLKDDIIDLITVINAKNIDVNNILNIIKEK